MKSQTTPARVSGTLDSLVRSLTIMQMEQIASKANQTKDAELRSAGLRMNHRLTAGDVRHILHAADYVANPGVLRTRHLVTGTQEPVVQPPNSDLK